MLAGASAIDRRDKTLDVALPELSIYDLVRFFRSERTLYRDFSELSISEKLRCLAKHEVKKPRMGVDNKKVFDIEKLRGFGEDYLNGLKGKRILLLGKRKDVNEKIKKCCVFLKCKSLLHKEYTAHLLKKFECIDDKKGVGITLTLRCLNHRSPYWDIKKIKKCWNRLRLELRRRYYRWDGNYFLVVEVGEKHHMVHLHIILYGFYYIYHKWLKETWHKITGDSYVVYCNNPRKPKRATDYIKKYLGKSLRKGGTSVNGVLIMWASGMRLWSCSRGLFDWLKDTISILCPDWEWDVYLVSSDLEGYYEVKKEDYG